ncbi:KAP family NTPase [Halosquirtibacter xylanolyticus]|uniref:P-loop NTPase fold protein n=1 Tax=Halosquirtibacter xylanolyticus TaxID=3374599 RepID=UPI00374876AE|nr:KAP family NTPase [Prolixibacteraceae bacterium]
MSPFQYNSDKKNRSFVGQVISLTKLYKKEMFFSLLSIVLVYGFYTPFTSFITRTLVRKLLGYVPSNSITLIFVMVFCLFLWGIYVIEKIQKRYVVPRRDYFWVGFVTFWYVIFRFDLLLPEPLMWSYTPIFRNLGFCYVDLWIVVPLGVLIAWVVICKKQKEEVGAEDLNLLDDKEVDTYVDLFPSRRGQVDFILRELQSIGRNRSFAIGITSPWGGGKTSFLNAIKDRISKDHWTKEDFRRAKIEIEEEEVKLYRDDNIKIKKGDYLFVDYSPWYANSEKEVIAHFLDVMKENLSPYHGELERNIDRYRKLLLSMSDSSLKSAVESCVAFFSDNKDISSLFNQVDRCIEQIGRKVLVFMDDLDRLGRDELVTCIKILRNTGSFKNVIFLVTYDKKYVTNQLTDYFAVKANDSKEGARFLEKFIQMEVMLPYLYPEEIRDYAMRLFRKALPEQVADIEKGDRLKLEQFFIFSPRGDSAKPIDLSVDLNNPRKWVTIVNHCYQACTVMKGEYDFRSLILMLVFKEIYPKEAGILFQEISMFPYEEFRKMLPKQEREDKKKVNSRRYEIGDYDVKYMQFIDALFVLSNFDRRDYRGYNRVSFHRNYLFYYNLNLSPYEIDNEGFNVLLNSPEELLKLRVSKLRIDSLNYIAFWKLFEYDIESRISLDEKRIIALMIRNDEEDFSKRKGMVHIGSASDTISNSLNSYCYEDLRQIFIDKYDFILLDCKIKFLTDQLNNIRNDLTNPEFESLWNSLSLILLTLFGETIQSNNYSGAFFQCYKDIYHNMVSHGALYNQMFSLLDKHINNREELYCFLIQLNNFKRLYDLNNVGFYRMKIFSENDPLFISDLEKKLGQEIMTEDQKGKVEGLYSQFIRVHKDLVISPLG